MILEPPAQDEVKRKSPFGSSTMTGDMEERGRFPPLTVRIDNEKIRGYQPKRDMLRWC